MIIVPHMLDAITALRTRRAEIARAIEALVAEDQELATTEQVLARLSGEGEPTRGRGAALVRSAGERTKGATRALKRPRSQREFVLDALSQASEPWLRTTDIIAEVKARWGEVIPEMSLRPLLTNLKKSRHITRQGRYVALRERAHEAKPLKDARSA